MLNLRQLLRNHRRTARGFAELVPWMVLLTPRLVLNKDGALLAVFELDGFDAEGTPAAEIDRQVRLLEQALRNCDERCALWWIVDRRRCSPPLPATFAHPVSAHLDALWLRSCSSGALLANRHALAITFDPGARAHLDRRWPWRTRRSAFAWEAAQLDVEAARFEDLLRAITETLSEIALRRLEGAQLLRWLHDRVSPAAEGEPVAMPDPPCYLDAWLPDNTLQVLSDRLRFEHLDAVEIAALAVKAWPGASSPGALDALLRVPAEITLVLAFRFERHERAAARIRDAERHHRNLQKSFAGYVKEAITGEDSAMIDEGRLRLAEDAAQALAHLGAEGGAFGHCALVLLARGRTLPELDEALRAAASALRRIGFLVLRERLNLLGAFTVSLPGQWALSPRWQFVTAATVADLAPLRTLASGSAANAHLGAQTGCAQPALARLPAEGGDAFDFDLHVGDVGHAIVIGPSGCGKSVLMNFLLSQSRKYPGSRVFVFDRNYSCRIPALLQGGAHVDLGAEQAAVRLNPLHVLGDPAQRSWLLHWLELLITARGHAISSDDDRALADALELLAGQPASSWRLRSLLPLLPRRLAGTLAAWVGDAPHARWFDHAHDDLSLCGFTCIEVGRLFHTPRLAAAFLDYAFQRIESALDGTPAFIYVEEAWCVLAEPRFCARLDDWLRTLRKKNAAVILATQSLQEIEASPILASVIDNIPTRIYLANPNAGAHRRLNLERFALNDTQLSRICQAIPKRDCYITQPGRSRMVRCVFPPALLAALRSDPQAQRLFLHHWRSGQPGWAFAYLDAASATVQVPAPQAPSPDPRAQGVS